MATSMFPVGPTWGDQHDTIPAPPPVDPEAQTLPSIPPDPPTLECLPPDFSPVCEECAGTGVIHVEDYGVFGGPGSARTVECDRCGGSGELDEEDLVPALEASLAKVRAERGRR